MKNARFCAALRHAASLGICFAMLLQASALPSAFALESDSLEVSEAPESTNIQTLGAELPVSIVSGTTEWRYLDDGTDPAEGAEDRTVWTLPDFDDSAWSTAVGSLGAKRGAISDLGGGCTPANLLHQYKDDGTTDIEAFFFRTKVTVEDPSAVGLITGSLLYDDGAIVYINGERVAAFDDNACDASGNSLGKGFDANLQYGGSNDSAPKTGTISISDEAEIASLLHAGENTVAVELHQGRASSSDLYMDFASLTFESAPQEVTVEQNSVALAPGSDETQMNFNWYASASEAGSVRFAKQSELVGGELPSSAESVAAVASETNRSGFYADKAIISGLQPGTTYAYELVNGDTVSDLATFTTEQPGAFKFLLVGDPQMGASGTLSSDNSGWENTLNAAANQVPDAAFILSAGDQVNTASNEDQYSAYLEHAQLLGMPVATVVGNHDSSSNAYSQHFNVPNASSQYGLTTAGGDSWFRYGDVLFLALNVNNMSEAEHKAFMEDAIRQNTDATWRIVAMHHSVYSVANHASESDILQRRETLVPIFKELGINAVLQGHDHVYVRSYMMDGLTPVTDPTAYDNAEMNSVTDTDDTLYITANSASGSKYYTIQNAEFPYAAVKNQERVPNFSEVSVSDSAFTITTYRTTDLSVVDTFTIHRTTGGDETAPVLTAATATRTGDAAATVRFTSDEAGTYYYAVVDDGAEAPSIDTTGSGNACDTAEQTLSLTGLNAGAKDVYVVVKDASGNVSEPLKIDLDAFASSVNQVTLSTNPFTILGDNRTVTFLASVRNLKDVDVIEGLVKMADDRFEITDIQSLYTGGNFIFQKNLDYSGDGTTAYFSLSRIGGFADADSMDLVKITITLKNGKTANALEAALASIAMYFNGDDAASIIAGDGKASTVISMLPGDVTFDGVVNGKDISCAMKLFGKTQADADWYEKTVCADVNENGVIDMGDLTSIAWLAAGKPASIAN